MSLVINFFQRIKARQVVVIFLLVLFIEKYISYYLMCTKTGEATFNFKNFLIYNYSFNTILELLRVFFIAILIYIGYYIMNSTINLKSIVKAVTFASFAYFLKYPFLYYWSVNRTSYTKEQFSEKFTLKLSAITETSSQNELIHSLFESVNLYDFIFLSLLILFLCIIAKHKLSATIKTISYTFLPVVFLFKLGFILLIFVL